MGTLAGTQGSLVSPRADKQQVPERAVSQETGTVKELMMDINRVFKPPGWEVIKGNSVHITTERVREGVRLVAEPLTAVKA